ncbi:hypothetical protein ACLOJK_024530 [Asimina triloba]
MAGKKRKSQQQPLRHQQPLGAASDDASTASTKRSRPPKSHQKEQQSPSFIKFESGRIPNRMFEDPVRAPRSGLVGRTSVLLNKTADFQNIFWKWRSVSRHRQWACLLISSDLSSKILKEALNQQKEILEEEAGPQMLTAFSSVATDPSIALDSDGEGDFDAFDGFSETKSQYDGHLEEIDEEDEKVLEAFMSKDAGPQLTLTDLIIQRIKEKDAEVISAFKHITSMEVWEDVLYLTEPEKWSPNAMYQATRIFASNLGPRKAQRFYNLVLLPRVREDIKKNKRLHFSLYQALMKSLYKPAAFFKGILLPLCQSGTCNLREAVIVGSVIQKASIPPLHSSAALMKLAEMEYCGTTSYFIKLFLDKKYALPYRVLDAVVDHFMRFLEDTRLMPVIWHQSLLAFVQRYKNELTKEEKDNLERLVQYQKHHLVTPEIRRELKNSRNRGEKEDDVITLRKLREITCPRNHLKREGHRWSCLHLVIACIEFCERCRCDG